MVKEPPPPFCSSSRVFALDDIDMMNFRCCCCCCFVPIFPLGGSTVVQVGRWRHCRMSSNNNVYNCHLTPDNEPRQTCFRSAPQDSFANRRRFWYVSQKEMRRNEGPVPFISSGGYRACAFWRKALIGRISSSFALIGQHILSSDSVKPADARLTGHTVTPSTYTLL